MCLDHYDQNLMPCYFLKIPIEMRFRIYRLLLPDKPIPALYAGCRDLRTDGYRHPISILRVNRQIHDEAIDILYSTRTFNIEVSGNSLGMCNSLKNTTYPNSLSNHQLQDYQMQLMLLEQQSKRRIMMARAQENYLPNNGSSSTAPPPPFVPNNQPLPPPTMTYVAQSAGFYSYSSTPTGPVWDSPLLSRYFNLINFFHVTVTLPSTYPPNHPPSLVPLINLATLNSLIYDYSDRLHALVGRLLLHPRPISRLEVSIKFNDNTLQRPEAIYAAQFLLRPFRRLCNVIKPVVLSITMKGRPGDPNIPEIDLLSPTWPEYHYPDDMALSTFLTAWTTELQAPIPALPPCPIFEAYWKLENMIKGIRRHFGAVGTHLSPGVGVFETPYAQFGGGNGGLGRLGELLGVARVAREDGDRAAFEECWGSVVGAWCEFLEGQRAFQEGIAGEIDGIYDVIRGG
jgi:hypothetical protein